MSISSSRSISPVQSATPTSVESPPLYHSDYFKDSQSPPPSMTEFPSPGTPQSQSSQPSFTCDHLFLDNKVTTEIYLPNHGSLRRVPEDNTSGVNPLSPPSASPEPRANEKQTQEAEKNCFDRHCNIS